MIKTMKWTLANIALASCVLAVSPAFSQADTRLVSYNDLNLASSAGRATLQGRIDRAVTAVCGRSVGWDTTGMARAIRQCRAESLHQAGIQVASLTRGPQQLASRSQGILIASR